MSCGVTESGEGLNAIVDPIRAKGSQNYKKFQFYLYYLLTVERMSRYMSDELAEVVDDQPRGTTTGLMVKNYTAVYHRGSLFIMPNTFRKKTCGRIVCSLFGMP